tara:strand:+ start:200 stop:664 length:465 start_codon:yes stop_codon:yes gene_type:complete
MLLKKFSKKTISLVVIFLFQINFTIVNADEKIDAVIDQIQIISQDLKTLEKAVYKSSDITLSTNNSSGLNEDILTKHLLKLNEIEDQFRKLTNKFEEINFKMDKLSNRVTKIQSDTQLRFSDLESGNTENKLNINTSKKNTKKILPGSSNKSIF